jgi:hypothetical protein
VTVNTESVSFYKGLGGGKYAAPIVQSLPLQTTGGFGPAFAADFNGDGKLDVASAFGPTCYLCTYGPVTILLGNGDGTFTQGTSIMPGGNANAGSIALADFNGDHKPDIAISDVQTNQTWIYLGNGDGTFTLSDTQPNGGDQFVVGDFNGDGKQDLAYYENFGNFGILLGNGDGTLKPSISARIPAFVTSLAVGDFYNNHIQSIAAVADDYNNSNIYLYSIRLSNGALSSKQMLIGNFPNAGPSYAAGGDLNGDFKFDVFLAGRSGWGNGSVYSAYMLGNGDGTFQSAENAPNNASTGFELPIIRDFNLDSRHDVGIAWFSSTPGGGVVQLLNTNAAQNCAPPKANRLGVHICAPTSGETVGSTFTFKGAGNAFSGIAKRMELWIDGHKVGQDLEDQLNVTTTLTLGKHTASFVVVDSFDNYTSRSVTFTVN